MLRIQPRCSKWGSTVDLAPLAQQSAHRKISTQNVQSALAHMKGLSKPRERPTSRSHGGKEVQIKRREDHTRQSVGRENTTKGFNIGDGRLRHEVNRLNRFLLLRLGLEEILAPTHGGNDLIQSLKIDCLMERDGDIFIIHIE